MSGIHLFLMSLWFHRDMKKIRCYKDLVVWQKSVLLVEEVYSCTCKLPKLEGIGLVSQMQRASVSISSNIAEGSERFDKKEWLFFLGVARGSCAELETQLQLASKLYKYIDFSKAVDLLAEVYKMLNRMTTRVLRG